MRVAIPLLAAALTTLAACSTGASAPARHDPSAVQVSVTSCGTGWTPARAGAQTITVHNSDLRPGEAQLVDPHSGAVFADVEPLGPGTSDRVRVSLSAGTYAWRCLMEDETAITGPDVRVTGPARGTTPGVLPVTQADLVPATRAYERYVSGRLPTLLAQTMRLRRAIAAGDLAAARHAWLPAHLQYERLGAAYDAFGELDGAINGLPDGLPGGVHDAGWTGFHGLEYGLWHGQPARQLTPVADLLARDVDALRHRFATAEIDPLQIAIRAHEITENALEFELTGRTDFGSHSALATVRANLEGTAEVLHILHAVLVPRYGQLSHVQHALTTAEHDLGHADHVRVDADISELCELLAPIASILEPRRTS